MARAQNPVLSGFHPDPSMIQVDGVYYIANSTFEWYPGVEIHSSRDLRSWRLEPAPLSEKRLLDMTGDEASCGIWAPCLSYSEGLFYLIFTNVRNRNLGPWRDMPNFLTTASSIKGTWETPVFLNASGFDPSLFHDDDGRKWLVNMEIDWMRHSPERSQFSGILLQEYSSARKRLVGAPRKIWRGTELGVTEGPHLYKKDGFYYLVTAEGGTGYGHAVSVARSRSIAGPYETHPHNPLLTSYGHKEMPALRKAGHASLCASPEGRSYIAFLCSRPLPGTEACPLGRETAIAEVVWQDGWPYLKSGHGKPSFSDGVYQNAPPDSFELPVDSLEEKPKPVKIVYKFDGAESQGGKLKLPPDFKTLRGEPDPKRYSLSARPGYLRLRGGESPASFFYQTLLARRQTDFSFSAETRMEFLPESFQEFAGLTWRYDESNQYLFSLSQDAELGLVLVIQMMKNKVYSRTKALQLPAETLKNGGIYLGIRVDSHYGRFRYSFDGKLWRETGPVLEAACLSDENARGFTGAFVGVFCCDLARYKACADFEYFTYAGF